MMDESGEPVVMDFGLAKQVADANPNEGKLTRIGAILGTPSYMAPEQVKGESSAIGPATDIYSLGVMLFEMLTGSTPYTGSAAVVMGQILAAPAPLVKEFRPKVDSRLDAICRQAMAKNPTDRFPRMAELAKALGYYVQAPSASPPLVPAPPAAAIAKVPAPVVERSPFEELEAAVPLTPAAKKPATKKPALKKPAAEKAKWGPVVVVAVAAALALSLVATLGCGLAIVLLRVETPNGTLVVEMNDKDVEARIKNGKLILCGPDGQVRYTLTANERSKQLETGPYKIRVEGADGLVLDTPEFTIKKGQQVTVHVTLAQKAMAKKDKQDLNPGRPGADDKGFVSLFNGKDLTGWTARNGTPAEWEVKDGTIEVTPGKGDIITKENFGPNFKLHVEFWLPLMADVKDQARANSGVFLQGRYEIQILDSYLNDTFSAGAVGALYGFIAPDKEALNKAIRKPETWNTLDIAFQAPRVDEKGTVTEPGRLTVILNDITIIKDATFDQTTGDPLDNQLGKPGPIRLQDHGASVRFRNLKIMALTSNKPADHLSLVDPFQPKSGWVNVGQKMTLTVLERNGEKFIGRFEIGDAIDREVTGTVKDGKLSWLAKDVRAIKGGVGGDYQATLTSDKVGDILDFVWRIEKGGSGAFSLRLRTGK